jgi:CBS-domain-containing membrane protein
MRAPNVRDVMTNEVLIVPADAEPAEVVSRLTAHDVSALAVVDTFDVVIGVVSRSDVLKSMTWPQPQSQRPGPLARLWGRPRPGVAWRRTTAREMMSAPAMTIGPDETTAQAARRMHRAGVKRLLVTDRRRRLLGIVTAADLIKIHGRTDDDLRAGILANGGDRTGFDLVRAGDQGGLT